jgi:general secretion pathway protein D
MQVVARLTHLLIQLRKCTCAALFAGCCLFAGASTAIDNASANSELVTLNMRDADIHAVIQWIAEQTHKQIVIDPRVQGRVSVLADHPMTIEQAYRVFLALLEVHGFSTSDTDGVLRIYPAALAKISPKSVVDDFDGMAARGQIMHVMAVEHVSAGGLAELIKPLVGATGYVAALPETNNLVLADDGDNVKRLVELVQRMDRSGSLDIDVIKLQHASARDAAQVLGSLVKPSGTSGNGGGNGTEAPLSVAADERSNSVLLAGDPTSRQRARQLLQQLDQPITTASNTRVVYLHYLSAEEILPVLKSMITSQQKEAKDETTKQAAVNIEASKSNNALVLSGPPALLDNMQEVIGKLDIRRSQVLVEAVIVELNQELANKLGVQWNTDFQSNGVQAATNFGLAPTATSTTNPLSLLSSGLTLGYYRNGSLRALLNALATTNDANVLSTPSVMTLDNQEAQIIVGSNIPVVTGEATGTTSSTDQPFTTFERKDIGVTLKITPQINSGDAVTLEIMQEVQTVADTANSSLANAKDIVTNKRSITTKVLVNDDTTIVLGGLISNQDQQMVSKVPILGDMPLIGRLFRSTSNKVTKQNLMVFIHPTIVDSGAVADGITRQSYDAMRVQQMKYHGGKFDEVPTKRLPEYEEFQPKRKTPAAEQNTSEVETSSPAR